MLTLQGPTRLHSKPSLPQVVDFRRSVTAPSSWLIWGNACNCSLHMHAGSSDGSNVSPSNWTGLVDLEEEDTFNSTNAGESITTIENCTIDSPNWKKAQIMDRLFASSADDPWSSESHLTLQLIPGQSLSWGGPLEPGPDSEEFLRPPVQPTAAEKKV